MKTTTCLFNHLSNEDLAELKLAYEIERMELYRIRNNPVCSLAKITNQIEEVTMRITDIEDETRRRAEEISDSDLFVGIEIKPYNSTFEEYGLLINLQLSMRSRRDPDEVCRDRQKEIYLAWKTGVPPMIFAKTILSS